MRNYRDRLDEHVRQITQLAREQTAALSDPVAKQGLLEEIMSMPSTDSPQSPAHPRGDVAAPPSSPRASRSSSRRPSPPRQR